MIRLQEVLLSLAAGGIVAALVMSGRTGSGDRGWDPVNHRPHFSVLRMPCQSARATRAQHRLSGSGPALRSRRMCAWRHSSQGRCGVSRSA